jgi:beta-N-acetylhexosaminidase
LRSFILFLSAALLASALSFSAPAPSKPRKPAPAKVSPAARAWLRSMTLRDRAAQLVFVPFYGEPLNSHSEEYKKYLRWVRHDRVGGLLLLNHIRYGAIRHADPFAMAAFVNRMQRAARVPLLVAGDFERGDSMRVISETLLPHAMAFAATRDPELSRFAGALTARQARALGVPWILAPVCDVNVNPDNPILNIRTYGENPEEVIAHVRAFITGARSGSSARVLVTAKHFPGHGDTAIDTHLTMAVVNADRAHLDAIELPPFRAAIAASVDSVMSAHLAVPSLDSPDTPATLSHAILTGLLRDKLGFKGLIVTDALDMHAITQRWNPAETAVKAIQAGADVLLIPPNPEQAIDGIVRAVRRGVISRRRLDESVLRVLTAKVRVGLNQRRLVDLDHALDELDSPDDIQRVQEIADRAVTLVKNEGPLVPLKGRSVCFLVLPESNCSQEGKQFALEVRRRAPAAQVVTLGPTVSDADFAAAVDAAKNSDVVVAAAFASVAAYRGSLALAGSYPKFLEDVIATGRPVILVALGNPYLVRAFPGVSAYLTTYSTVPPSETAAVKALFGEIPIRGRLPVTIPDIAKYGDGIQLDRLVARGK